MATKTKTKQKILLHRPRRKQKWTSKAPIYIALSIQHLRLIPVFQDSGASGNVGVGALLVVQSLGLRLLLVAFGDLKLHAAPELRHFLRPFSYRGRVVGTVIGGKCGGRI